MIPVYPPGRPTGRLRERLARLAAGARGLLRRARHGLLRARHGGSGLARRAGQRLRRERDDLAELARQRWPGVRDHGVALWRRTAHWVRGLPGRAGPWAERLAAWVRRAIRQARPAVRRAVLTLRQHRPTPRQAAVLALAILGISWVLWERCGLRGCPDVEALTSYQPGGASVLLDQAGEPFADLAPMEYEVVPLDSLPDYVPQAFIAVEDRRFREHAGVDWVRVLGAAWADVQAGGLVQGSSTIPMQLSRTLFTDRIRREDKTFRRKLMEARVAREIEDRFTKDEILELYLNHVYLGGGSYGVQAASRYFFGKEAWALTMEEAALLAGLPRAPAHYDPRRNPEAARNRRDLVLALMADQGYLEPAAADSARSRELAVTAEPDRDPDGDQLAPYFVQHVRRQLEDVLGETLYLERLRIHTTLDRAAQEAAEAELEAQLRTVEGGAFGRASGSAYAAASGVGEERVGYLQGAVVLMDARGGEVRAWVGGRDYDHSRYDRARLARRQAGSAFKPFVYAAALEAGLSPSQPILDSPYRLAGGGGRVWQPENYSGRFEGRMSMRDALVRSQNVPAVRLAAAVGPERLAHLVARAGIRGGVPESPVAALGVTVASPLEMATAYAGLATTRRPEPRFVLRVEDEEGEVLWESQPEWEDVTDPATSFLLTDMLRDVVDRGTGTAVRRVGFRGPAAGKTGTTSDATDVWFVGYNPHLVGAVWVGFDEVRPLPSRATGGGIAAPVWGRVMAAAYRDAEPPDWDRVPGNVVSLWVDPETGLVLEDGCRPRRGSPRRELFLESSTPVSVCPRRGRRDFGERLGGWFESLFGSRRDAPRIPGTVDPDLGYPRLPPRDADDHQRAEDGRQANRSPYMAPSRGSGSPARGEMDRRWEERLREARKREEERVREAQKRQEELAREARKRQEERRREARRRDGWP